MNYELTATIRLDSEQSEDRVWRMFESYFEFGTIKESIADGLHLLEDPRLVRVSVAHNWSAASFVLSSTTSHTPDELTRTPDTGCQGTCLPPLLEQISCGGRIHYQGAEDFQVRVGQARGL